MNGMTKWFFWSCVFSNVVKITSRQGFPYGVRYDLIIYNITFNITFYVKDMLFFEEYQFNKKYFAISWQKPTEMDL